MIVNISMPVYNTDTSWLIESIESIKNQTYKNWKLIIVDDCITNVDTINFLDSINEKNIEVVRPEKNLGCDSARLFAKNFLDKDCKLVASMDADDIMLPTRLEEQVNFLNRNEDVGILGGQMQLFVDRSLPFTDMRLPIIDPLTSHPYNVNDYILSSDWVINNPSTMIRRSIVDDFNIDLIKKIQDELGLRRNVYGDVIFYGINAVKGVKIRNLSDVVIFYRVSKHNLSSKNWYGSLDTHKKLRKVLMSYHVS